MKINYIAILRSLSIILVVCFHVYGYMYADHLPGSKELYNDAYFWLNQCTIISVAMPMFTFISGFLFDYLYNKGKYQEFLPMIKKKALRLLLPFFVFGILMMFTVGVPFEPWTLLTGSFSHLWYLPALFWCFLLGWIIKRYINNRYVKLTVLIVFLFLQILGKVLPHVMGLHNITVWFGWFMLGEMVATYSEIIAKFIKKYNLVIPLILPFCIQAWFFPVEYGEQTWYSVLTVTAILISLWYLFSIMTDHLENLCKPLIWLSKYSFGIFIFHNWVGPYLISRSAQRLLPLSTWASDHIILFPLGFTMITLAVSLILSWLLMKTKVGRVLIG